MVIIRQHLPFVAQALRDRIVDGARGVERGLLRDEGDAGVRRGPAFTVVQVGLPGENPEQRRLAGAVAADQPDALTRIELQLRLVEQLMMAEREARAGER